MRLEENRLEVHWQSIPVEVDQVCKGVTASMGEMNLTVNSSKGGKTGQHSLGEENSVEQNVKGQE